MRNSRMRSLAAALLACALAAFTVAWAQTAPTQDEAGQDASPSASALVALDDEGDDETDDATNEQDEADEEDATVSVDEAGTVTVAAPDSFANAEIVYVETTLSDGTAYSTTAVVAEHTLTFYAQEAGDYTVSQFTYPTSYGYDGLPGMDVWANMSLLTTERYLTDLAVTEGRSVTIPTTDADAGGLSMSNGGDNVSNGALLFAPYKGVSMTSASTLSYGSEEDPIAALVHFVGTGEDAEGALEMTLGTQNGLLGYTTESDAALAAAAGVEEGGDALSFDTDYDAAYLVVEDRDEDTGRLVASVLFAPSEDSSPSPSSQGGQASFNLIVSPEEDVLAERLATHSSYADNEECDAEADAAVLAEIEGLDSCVLLANLDTMCAYATGGKVYTLDIGTLTGGELGAGDELTLTYVSAAGDKNANSGKLVAYYEELLLATDEDLTVDEDGYVQFTLYGGGVYALALDDEELAEDVAELAAQLTFVYEEDVYDDESDEESDGSDVEDEEAQESEEADATDTSSSTSSSSDDDSTEDTETVVTTTVVKREIVTSSIDTSTSGTGSSLSTDVSSDVDDDEDSSDSDADDAEADEAAEVDEAAETTDEVADADEEASQGSLFYDENGNLIRWRVALAVLAGVLALLLLWLLFLLLLRKRRKKDEEALEEQESAERADKQADKETPLTHEEATAAAVSAAARAREQAGPAQGGLGSAAYRAATGQGPSRADKDA